MDPITASIIISAIGSGLSGAAGMANSGQSMDIARMQDQGASARNTQNIAYQESLADPFRQQMFQGKDLGMLDMMGQPQPQGNYAPAGRYATPGRPPAAGGYQPSPELMQWLLALKNDIAGGQNRAPSVAGNGTASTMNLLDPVARANAGRPRNVAPGVIPGAAGPDPNTQF